MAELTTLNAVKRYLAIKDSNQDALIATLIARESRLIERWTGRCFPPLTWSAVRLDGTGGGVLTLPEQPVLDVSSVVDGSTTIPLAADSTQTGFMFDSQRLYLNGGARFTRGRQNITVTWTTGYKGQETDSVPASGATVLEPEINGAAVSPISVVDASTGVALTQVASNPATGQYAFDSGIFIFAAADAGRSVTMSYYCIPGPVAQACVEMIGFDLKSRDNIGINSKTLAGETISYSSKGMNDSVKEQLLPYKKMQVGA